jgi:type II secretory pathway pseudopilin PulG
MSRRCSTRVDPQMMHPAPGHVSAPRARIGRRGLLSRPVAAFSLVEVMFSILIMGVGLVAVASLFPIAGSIQRATFDDVTAVQVAKNAQSAIKARGFSEADLLLPDLVVGYNPLVLDVVQPLPRRILDWDVLGPPLGAQVNWLLTERCYPAPIGTYIPQNSGSPATPPPTEQPYYWVPLILKESVVLESKIFVFIMKKQPGVSSYTNIFAGEDANMDDPASVPHVKSILVVPNTMDPYRVTISPASGVVSASDLFEVGDLVLDSLGQVHRVVDVGDLTQRDVRLSGVVGSSVSKLWYGVRGTSSPTRYILPALNKVIF